MTHAPFDPDFDDCAWTEAWTHFPIIQVVPGVYKSFTVKNWQMHEADICGRRMRIDPPLAVRGLILNDGRLWMSDVPQERLMMFNNAQVSRGRVLVGGLGLGLYPQYALPHIDHLHIIERDAGVCRVVEPVVRVAAESHRIAVHIQITDIETSLLADPDPTYDTIFLDTWDTLDAAHLPTINHLRDLAIRHLKPDGQVLLWGYRWMLHLFEEACQNLLRLEPGERQVQLTRLTRQRPAVTDLLLPVLEHFAGQRITEWNAALAWCRAYATQVKNE